MKSKWIPTGLRLLPLCHSMSVRGVVVTSIVWAERSWSCPEASTPFTAKPLVPLTMALFGYSKFLYFTSFFQPYCAFIL